MKKMKQMISLLTLTTTLALLSDAATLTADAAEPTTYSIAYVADEGEWRYQKGAEFDFEKSHRDADDIGQSVENGDNVIIWGDSEHTDIFKIPAYLNNLTVLNARMYVVVYTNGISQFHASMDSIVAVNGDIQNAYVYDNAQVTFNNNIGTLDITASYDDAFASATCEGTVGRVLAHDAERVFYDVYNVAQGKLKITDVSLKTDAQYYSTSPGAAPAAPAPAPASTPTPAPSTDSSATNTVQTPAASNDYDEVPKTGESHIVLLLLGIAVTALFGNIAIKKTHKI